MGNVEGCHSPTFHEISVMDELCNGNPPSVIITGNDLDPGGNGMAASDPAAGLNGIKLPTTPTSIYYSLPPMPWFGMDIGGTLCKLVFFEPTDINDINNGIKRNKSDHKTLLQIRRYLTTNKAYGKSGHRDAHLQMSDVQIGGRQGTIHFIRFPTCQMSAFVAMAKEKGLATLASTVCATGGGAYKFEADIKREVNLKLNKFDELDSLIRGVEFMVENSAKDHHELFYYDDPQPTSESLNETPFDSSRSTIYPFMLVNIGSGVSILSVKGPDDYKRVYGTSLGGGTFLGLCCLLTGCNTFEEAMALAAKGDNRKADKLVRDIYGGDYERFGLSGDIVASSFGQMNLSEKRKEAKPEDLARATLVTITNNIGSITRLCAQAEKLERVLFVGNFLRINPISMKLLAFAMEFWSKGAIKALFCRHEGYLGAVGCLLELMKTRHSRLSSPAPTPSPHQPSSSHKS